MDTRRRLIGAVNVALRTSGVPEVGWQTTVGDDNGTFQFGTWDIAFGTGLAVTQKTSHVFISTVNTVYHEARHCEQWFRIAQALADGRITAPAMLPSTITRPQRGDSASIAAFMFIEARIAIEAVTHPTRGFTLSLPEVRRWFDSIYGFARTPRGVRLNNINSRYDDYRHLAEELDAWRQGDLAGEAVRADLHVDYPNLYDWKLLTKRSYHFRSGKFFGGDDSLTGVDAAIEAFQNNRSDQNRLLLRTAFNAWYDANPKERTKRDVPANGEPEGCITKLRNWLNQARGAALGGIRVM